MKRREFIKKTSTAVAAIPFVSIMADAFGDIEVPKSSFSSFDSAQFSKLVKEEMQKPVSEDLLFLHRTPIVDYLDDEELQELVKSTFTSKVYASDIITEDTDAIVIQKSSSVFEAHTSSVPNIKVGQKIGKAGHDKVTSGEHLRFSELYIKNLAKLSVTGIQQRINSLLGKWMTGGHDILGVHIGPETSGVHVQHMSKVPFVFDPVSAIRDHRKFMKDGYGVEYDRITVSSKILNNILASIPTEGLLKSRHLIGYVNGVLEAEVEVYNKYHLQKEGSGSIKVPYLPANTILFSSSKNDHNAEVFHFANGITAESVILEKKITTGPIGYYTRSEPVDEKDSGTMAWTVMRGLPILKDKLAFSTLTLK